MIVRLVTESMVYEVGSPLPVPPGFVVEPFVVVAIELVEEEDESGMRRAVLQVLARPDSDEQNQQIPEQPPEGADPRQHQLAYMYNMKAKTFEQRGYRLVATIPHHLVIRTERLVSVDEFEQLKAALAEDSTSEDPEEVEDGNGKPATEPAPAPSPAVEEPKEQEAPSEA